ncbi:MFS transporter [Bacillus spizizenii ATCC 6633 = JCM 2499]|uniref:Putative carboxylate transporter n=1 Tax=Bacillus spizizenii (strain ATCC 23059 / NRRL B-14472 / W23) TaxID=655816 RepID=E0U0A8_BACSH|nr:MFS transporter [Bacillus spizizenii]QCJ19581.1 MFS transporter [Bacillus subtilis]ADM36279.1 putative carboxylate transporter [Bacillus spizizenii str. W23]AJW87510.1 MFS transporter [Bacillus spizizenii]EFG91556.1 putative carboxylate transporter [Bacillus spizizenii ATCC 6633 = JCM 2499]KFK79096.1 major Facilitator Superfamily protein [Bacillus spizizenii]
MKRLHYAWIIVSVTFLILLAVQGVRLSFGAFVEPWERQFSMDRGTISLISTISFIVYGISQPVIGRLVDKWGARAVLSWSALLTGVSIFLTCFVTSPWQLFLLYGLGVSLGVGGASNVAASVLVVNWFSKKRGLAFGIMEAGFGAGQMLLVPGSLMLIHWFSWKLTVVVLGLLLIVIVFPAALLMLRNNPSEKNAEPIGGLAATEKETTPKSTALSVTGMFRMRQFWFLILPFLICGFTTVGLMDTHLIPFSHDHGFSTTVTSAAVSLLAGFNIAGILLSGIVADRWSSRKILCFLYAVRALSIVILIYSHEPYLLLAFAILFGLVDFATVAPTQMLATQYFQNYSIGLMIGWLSLAHQIGSALGAYVPGVIYTVTGEYTLAFYLSIGMLVLASVMNVMLREPAAVTRDSAAVVEKV